jgi:hypothetical protein
MRRKPTASFWRSIPGRSQVETKHNRLGPETKGEGEKIRNSAQPFALILIVISHISSFEI